MTSDLLVINPAGLIGHELCEAWRAELDACYDADGHCDYEDLDHTLGQIEQDQRDFEARADVLSVYAEEVLRFS